MNQLAMAGCAGDQFLSPLVFSPAIPEWHRPFVRLKNGCTIEVTLQMAQSELEAEGALLVSVSLVRQQFPTPSWKHTSAVSPLLW